MAFGVDNADFKKGAAEVRAETAKTKKQIGDDAKKMAADGKEAAKFFVELRNQAVALFAVLAGGREIKKLIEDTTNATVAVGFLAKNLGEATQTLNAWMNAAEHVDGSGQGMAGTMQMLSHSMTEMQVTGQTAILPYLRSLGVNLADATGRARPLEDVLLDLSDRLSSMDRVTANNIGKMMGIDQGTLNLILQGRKAVEEMIRKQKEMHLVTKADAEQALKLKQTFIDMRQTADAWARDIMTAITPALQWFLETLKDVGAWAREHKEGLTAFFVVVGTAIAIALVPPLVTAAVALWALIAPFAAVGAAVLGLGAAIMVLVDDYAIWKKGGDSFIDWQKWENEIQLVKDILKNFIDLVREAWSLIAKFTGGEIKFPKIRFGKKEDLDRQDASAGAAPAASKAGPANTPANAPAAAAGGGDAVSKLMGMGWSRAQATGIVANLHSESGMRANAVGDSGKAYGIAQWHPDRQAEFKKFAGKDIRGSTVDEQLAFVNHELRNGKEQGAGRMLSGTDDPRRAAEIISKNYERPLDREGEAAKRGALAEQMARRSMLAGNPSALAAAAPAGAGAAVPQAGGTRVSQSSNETHIGQVVVNTQATDAKGIARDMAGALKAQGLVNQADQGLT